MEIFLGSLFIFYERGRKSVKVKEYLTQVQKIALLRFYIISYDIRFFRLYICTKVLDEEKIYVTFPSRDKGLREIIHFI